MTIRIIDEPEITLTRYEYDRLNREWVQTQLHTTAPCSFETWLRHRQANEICAARNAELNMNQVMWGWV